MSGSRNVSEVSLRLELQQVKIQQQRILNWVLGSIGIGVFLILAGILFFVWRFALTVDL